jgi:hypothetical protein
MSGDFLHFVGYCFVDDTDPLEFPAEVTTAAMVATNIQQAVNAWEAGIRATGELSFPTNLIGTSLLTNGREDHGNTLAQWNILSH